MTPRILIVGFPDQQHVGNHFLCAARELEVATELVDARMAFGPGWLQRILWRIDRFPQRISVFEHYLLERIAEFRPTLLLTTGIAPIRHQTLRMANAQGCRVVNFLTDDPWNKAHRARWFFKALKAYQSVYTPRSANQPQLRAICSGPGQHVDILPFGYNPQQHFVDSEAAVGAGPDVLIVGGADRQRVPFVKALAHAKLNVHVMGGYWDRYRIDGVKCHGLVDSSTVRKATREAKTNLVLVRRANRDEHVMRSFEALACGGLLIVEDTGDHRRLFGPDLHCVAYCSSPDQAADQVLRLKSSTPQRSQMLANSQALVNTGEHTYASRLRTILESGAGN